MGWGAAVRVRRWTRDRTLSQCATTTWPCSAEARLKLEPVRHASDRRATASSSSFFCSATVPAASSSWKDLPECAGQARGARNVQSVCFCMVQGQEHGGPAHHGRTVGWSPSRCASQLLHVRLPQVVCAHPLREALVVCRLTCGEDRATRAAAALRAAARGAHQRMRPGARTPAIPDPCNPWQSLEPYKNTLRLQNTLQRPSKDQSPKYRRGW